MKAFIVPSAIILALLSSGFSSKNICNADLLYSYGVTSPQYNSQAALLCQTGETESCCLNNDESNMLSRWNNRDKNYIKPYYQAVMWLMKAVFAYYEDIIVKAKYMYIDEKMDPKCRMEAEFLVVNYMTKDDIGAFVKNTKELFNYLGHLRKGFYCSMCSVRNQKYFDYETKKLVYSYGFCRDLITNSIDTIMERTVRVLPIFEKINSVINCKVGESAKKSESMMPNQLDYKIMKKCHFAIDKLKDPELWIDHCIDMCSRFSISEASSLFEGSIGPLESLFVKIRGEFEKPTDPFDDGTDTSKIHHFAQISPVFFEPMLSFQDLSKFTPLFEKYGVDLKKEADISLFFYGEDADLELYAGAGVMSWAMTVALLVLTLFK
jgi:hypothetical protein